MEHKELSFKTAIITGVGGFFGSHLCERLLTMGIKVIGVDINENVKERFKSPNYSHITATFEDYSQLHTMIMEPVDIFFHFAWSGGLLQESFWNYELQLKNAYFGCIAFEEANKIGCKRFINSGTNNQISTKQNLCAVDFTPRGTDIYSASKTCLELICKTLATRAQTEFIGTMIPMPYGKGNRSMQLFNVVVKNLLDGQSPKLIEGKNLYDIVYVEDVVSAFIAVADE